MSISRRRNGRQPELFVSGQRDACDGQSVLGLPFRRFLATGKLTVWMVAAPLVALAARAEAQESMTLLDSPVALAWERRSEAVREALWASRQSAGAAWEGVDSAYEALTATYEPYDSAYMEYTAAQQEYAAASAVPAASGAGGDTRLAVLIGLAEGRRRTRLNQAEAWVWASQARYTAVKATYERARAAYTAATERYETARAAYETGVEAYERASAEWEAAWESLQTARHFWEAAVPADDLVSKERAHGVYLEALATANAVIYQALDAVYEALERGRSRRQ